MGTEPEPPVRRAYEEAVALLTELGVTKEQPDLLPIAHHRSAGQRK